MLLVTQLFAGKFVFLLLGPFSTCREVVDATPYFETCTYDVCVTGDVESFCAVVSQFSSACIKAGLDPGKWWELVTGCGT